MVDASLAPPAQRRSSAAEPTLAAPPVPARPKFGLRTIPLAVARSLVRASMAGMARGPHVTRFSMYERLARAAPRMDIRSETLAISGSLPLCRVLGLNERRITQGTYPVVDLLDLPYDDGAFDAIVSDQVLEHLSDDPRKAFDESWRVLRPGGLMVHTTCFVNPVHDSPYDFWRFTPNGLRLLAKRFDVLDAGGWGNPYVWLYCGLGLRHDGIPLARWHPVNKFARWNNPDWPIVTWIVARKPAGT